MKEENKTALAPKEFLKFPIFASKPQKTSRSVQVFNSIWNIGVPDPLGDDDIHFPALDIRHAKVIFILLSKFNIFSDETTTINFTIYELCEVCYGLKSGNEYRKIKKLLKDLRDTFIEIDDNGKPFRIIKSLDYRTRYKKADKDLTELRLENVELDPFFVKTLMNSLNIYQIQLFTFLALKNPLASAIYTYIPASASKCDINHPCERTLTTLLKDMGETVPKTKSERKQKFYRKDAKNHIDIVGELDGIKINSNKLLHCKMVDTVDKKDYKLLFWSEQLATKIKPATGVLAKEWKASGRSEAEWNDRMTDMNRVYFNHAYELPALELMNDWKSHEQFFKMSKCLLGGHFSGVLGDAKNYEIEQTPINGKPLESFKAYVIYLIKKAIREGG